MQNVGWIDKYSFFLQFSVDLLKNPSTNYGGLEGFIRLCNKFYTPLSVVSSLWEVMHDIFNCYM